ncbi:hypothetical protein BDB00DRAFT_374617 [Zychaea mexicana]|uniref:uncharacterized protein n=1 Tax=Zychaea mexicana TaxID=64656 RepID=UPI0022FE8F3E|nr:uncharacterized protein BDB00DRAFT_374617 [Zychaea mexicana]KAI9493508.1 hypothetical protein BDB00DRAFT_374617 [Zychaea mexicana]
MTQASAQNNPRQKKKEVPNDVQVLESLKDELSVHAFWIETEWQKWSIQSFDAAAVKLNPGITKANAHLDLTYDINIILKALKDKASRRCLRLKQMKNDLKSKSCSPSLCFKTNADLLFFSILLAIGKDKINNHFWREQVVSEALVESEEKAMKRKRAVAEECFAVATLEKMTNQTQELVGAKRSIEQVGESSSSTPKRQEMTSPLKEK